MFPVDAIEEELGVDAGLEDGGGALDVVSLAEVAAEEADGSAERVEVEGPREVQDVVRPAEKLGRGTARRSCTSRSAIQAR